MGHRGSLRRMWVTRVSPETKEWREPGLAIQSLQPRREDGSAGRLAVPHLPVALDRVDARAPRAALAAVVVADAVPGVLPLLRPGPGLLEQRLAQQAAAALVVPAVGVLVLVVAGGLHVAMLHLGAEGPGPGVPVAIVPGHGVCAGVATGEQAGGEGPGADPLGQRRVVISLPLLLVVGK